MAVVGGSVARDAAGCKRTGADHVAGRADRGQSPSLDSGANLVAFARMDGAQVGSIPISQHKARVAVTYRRPSKVFEDAVQKSGANYLLSLDDIIASRGGIPLIADGKIVGAIGCSGGAGSQDEVVCMTGAATINK